MRLYMRGFITKRRVLQEKYLKKHRCSKGFIYCDDCITACKGRESGYGWQFCDYYRSKNKSLSADVLPKAPKPVRRRSAVK